MSTRTWRYEGRSICEGELGSIVWERACERFGKSRMEAWRAENHSDWSFTDLSVGAFFSDCFQITGARIDRYIDETLVDEEL